MKAFGLWLAFILVAWLLVSAVQFIVGMPAALYNVLCVLAGVISGYASLLLNDVLERRESRRRERLEPCHCAYCHYVDMPQRRHPHWTRCLVSDPCTRPCCQP